MKWLPKGPPRASKPGSAEGNMEKQSPGQKQVQIQIDPGEVEGTYSNFVILAHSPSEFILDFARILPGVPKAKVYSRIIMTPQNAMSLLQALEAKIKAYEDQFGKIRAQGTTASTSNIGFKTD